MTNPSRAEPFAGRADVSLPAHAADLGARHHKEAGSAMEPAKSRENNHDGSQAAVTGSAAKPRSDKAEHRITLEHARELINGAAAGVVW